MNLNDYQKQAYKYAKYPESVKGIYNALQIANELGEVAGKFIKSLRDGMSDKLKKDIGDEIGDVIWHMAGLCSDVNRDFYKPSFFIGFDDFDSFDTINDIVRISNNLYSISYDVTNSITENGFKNIYDDFNQEIWSVFKKISENLNFNLDDILQNNLDKLESRFQRGVIGGSGDKR